MPLFAVDVVLHQLSSTFDQPSSLDAQIRLMRNLSPTSKHDGDAGEQRPDEGREHRRRESRKVIPPRDAIQSQNL